MSFLIDTCVVSELRKPLPDPGVSEWLDGVSDELLWISGISLGELRYGIDRLPEGRKKRDLQVWYEEVRQSFARQTVGCSAEAFVRWGELRARRETAGSSLPLVDGLLAAVAIEGNFTLVTRNSSDFRGLGVEVLNPWASAGSC